MNAILAEQWLWRNEDDFEAETLLSQSLSFKTNKMHITAIFTHAPLQLGKFWITPPLSKRWVGHVLPVPPVNSFPARSTSAKDWLNDREFFKSIIVNLKKLKLTFYAKDIMTNTINKNPCPRNLVTKNSKPSARAETKFYGATKKLTFHNFESGLRKRYHAHKRLKLF